jgi:hypothetical protein
MNFSFVIDLILDLFGFMVVTVFCVPLCVSSMCELYVNHIVSADSGISFQAF